MPSETVLDYSLTQRRLLPFNAAAMQKWLGPEHGETVEALKQLEDCEVD